MQKILLYYKFTPLNDPEAIKLWQKSLTDSLNLHGRILVSKHGLNGTVGGEIDDLKKYIKATKVKMVALLKVAAAISLLCIDNSITVITAVWDESLSIITTLLP